MAVVKSPKNKKHKKDWIKKLYTQHKNLNFYSIQVFKKQIYTNLNTNEHFQKKLKTDNRILWRL